MKRPLLLLISLCALGLRQQSYAQDFPQDWGNYANYLDRADASQSSGVNEFTGSINYSFNFYSLNVDGQNFPVSIGYSSNGIRVDEYASNVGLGWNLSAGGSITKITRGLDDRGTTGYDMQAVYMKTPINYYNGVADGEKDYFVFNAFGLSGSFFYDESTASYRPVSGEKITIEWQASPGAFIIKDDMGNAYHFTLAETIYTYSGTLSNQVNSQQGNWFLTKVVLASKKEINLLYYPKSITGLKVGFNEIASKWHTCTGGTHTGYEIYNSYSSFKVQSITSGNTVIEFGYKTTARLDITDDYALEKIDIKRNGAYFKSYILRQDYHSSRLMLNGIDNWIFATSTAQGLVNFDYYKDYTMPAPASAQSQDWGGYFNNQAAFAPTIGSIGVHNSLAPSYIDPTNSHATIDGANRDIAAATVIQTLLLKKVTDLYGKVEEFAYESNKYDLLDEQTSPPGHTETLTHGLRVSKVTAYELTQPDKKRYTTYTYTNANNHCTGILSLYISPNIVDVFAAAPSTCEGKIRIPNARRTRAQIIDAVVAYKEVKTRVYTNPADLATSTLGYTINTYSIDSPGYVMESFGGNPAQKFFYANKYIWGKPISSKSYNKTMQLVSRVDYAYEDGWIRQYQGFYVWMGSKTGSTPIIATHRYYFNPGYRRLKSITKYSYNPDAQLLATTKQVLTYDNAGYVNESKTYINTILKSRTTYKHAYDYSTSGAATHANGKAIYQMNQQGIAAPVIETVTYKVAGLAETVISAGINLYKYDNTSQVIQPDKTLSYNQVTPAATVTALSFNTAGVPSYPASYRLMSEARKFDDKQFPVEVISDNVEFTALHYNEEGNLLCSFDHAPFDNTAFMGFETYEIAKLSNLSSVNANWTSGSYNVAVVNEAATGTAGFDLSLCMFSPALEFTKTLKANTKYILRYWRKISSGSLSIGVNNMAYPADEAVLRTVSGWELIQQQVEGPGSLSIAGTATIDDLILYPLGASYQYQVYNNKDLKTAECDATGTCIFYEYDNLYRTQHIKDHSGNVLKAFEYGIQEQQ